MNFPRGKILIDYGLSSREQVLPPWSDHLHVGLTLQVVKRFDCITNLLLAFSCTFSLWPTNSVPDLLLHRHNDQVQGSCYSSPLPGFSLAFYAADFPDVTGFWVSHLLSCWKERKEIFIQGLHKHSNYKPSFNIPSLKLLLKKMSASPLLKVCQNSLFWEIFS